MADITDSATSPDSEKKSVAPQESNDKTLTPKFKAADNGKTQPDTNTSKNDAPTANAGNADDKIKPKFEEVTKKPAEEQKKKKKYEEPPLRELTDIEIASGLRKIVAPDGTITGWARHSGGQLSFGEAIEKLFTYLAASLSDDNVQAHMLLELFYPKEPKHKDYNDKIAGGDPGPASQAADTQKAALKKVVEDKNHPDRQLSTAEFTTKFFPHITNPEGETLLRPELLEKLEEKGPTTFKNHVNMAIAAVKEYNDNLSEGQIKLDTNLFLNQIYRESAFDANAIGKETRWGRARGMGQMIESVGEKYGLSSANNYADYFNPEKSLRAAVEHVGDLTQKYKSQRLATIAYNGGEGALRKIARALDKPVSELKSEEWIAYTDEQNQRLGKGDDDSWREQTNKYLKETAPEYWSDEQRQTAIAKMEDLGLIKPEPEPPTQVASTPPSPIKT